MIKLITAPTIIKAAGNIPKEIREYIGKINSNDSNLSIAHMKSPQGWVEPGQTPEFNEYTLVLKGILKVETTSEVFMVHAGQGFIAGKGEWVKYSTPSEEGAEYISVCHPAFSPKTVNRDVK